MCDLRRFVQPGRNVGIGSFRAESEMLRALLGILDERGESAMASTEMVDLAFSSLDSFILI